MTVTAQRGELYFAPKTARQGSTPTWYKFRALDIGLGVVDNNQNLPPEVGGQTFPTGAFKDGAFVAGGARMIPRLEADIGWLIYAATGSADTTADDPEAGANTHTFAPSTSDDTFLPWIDVAKFIPGTDAVIMKGVDCKVTGLEITVPQAGILMFSPAIVGRIPQFIDDEGQITTFRSAAQAFEGYESIPLSAKGKFKVGFGAAVTVAQLKADSGGTYDVPALGAVITLTNNLTTPQEERVVGSYYPDDFVPKGRMAMVRFTYKWADPELYLRILTNDVNGTAWSPVPTFAPVLIEAQSPDDISGLSTPYTFRFTAQNVHWRFDGAPQLQAGGIIMQSYIGIVNVNDAGSAFEIELVNEEAGYTWPS